MLKAVTFGVLLPLLLLLTACATRPPAPTALQGAVPGAVVETISASVVLSLRTAEKNLSARGVMLYQRPDRMRLVLLSPFGTTLMEALVIGEELTLAYPGEGTVYQGRVADLPPAAGQRGFAMLHWVLASDPPAGAPQDGLMERRTERGDLERITLKNGLVVEKTLPGGEQVRYRNHAVLAGVLLPLELLMISRDGDRIRVQLEEPEVNLPLDGQSFSLMTRGLRRLPLSELKPY